METNAKTTLCPMQVKMSRVTNDDCVLLAAK